MGRPLKAVDIRAGHHLRALALHLRKLKNEAHVTYATLSRRTGSAGQQGYRGASTLSEAARGIHLPPVETVLAFARVAGEPGDRAVRQRVELSRELWKKAAAEKAHPVLAGRGPRISRARTTESLGVLLARLRARAGQPSLTAIEQASTSFGNRLPRSSVHLILAGVVLPRKEQLRTLLAVFGLSDTDAEASALLAAHKRISQRCGRPPRGVGQTCPDLDVAVEEHRRRREREEEIKRRTGQIKPHESLEDYEQRIAAKNVWMIRMSEEPDPM
ncbi:hypothetical protein ACWGNE_08310 [Streptomyces xiamenensis]